VGAIENTFPLDSHHDRHFGWLNPQVSNRNENERMAIPQKQENLIMDPIHHP
jgi:hypothetical protein